MSKQFSPEPGDDLLARAIFLRALAAGASVSGAARAAGRARPTFYTWRRRDAEFADQWEQAAVAGTDLLEDEALRRATQGTAKPIYYGGRRVGEERRHSDQLLMLLLKARRPEKFDTSNTRPPPGGTDKQREDAETFQKRLSDMLTRASSAHPATQAPPQPMRTRHESEPPIHPAYRNQTQRCATGVDR